MAQKGKELKKQIFFALASIFIIGVAVPCCYNAYWMSVYGQKKKPEGFRFPDFSEWHKIAISAVVLSVSRLVIETILTPVYKMVVKGNTDEARTKYAEKSAKKTYQLVYFSLSTFYGLRILSEANYLPWYLGGPTDGNIAKLADGFPFQPFSQDVMDYSLYTFGYRMADLILHIIYDERHNDFAEMFLHHITTCILYYSYIQTNFFGVGTIIAFLHDASDIPACMLKICSTIDAPITTLFWFIILVFSWGWARLYGFSQIIWGIHSSYVLPPEMSENQSFITFMVIFLSTLLFLHSYWLFLVSNMFLSYVVTGKAEDTQNKVTDDADKKQQ